MKRVTGALQQRRRRTRAHVPGRPAITVSDMVIRRPAVPTFWFESAEGERPEGAGVGVAPCRLAFIASLPLWF